MSEVAISYSTIPAMSIESVDKVRQLEAAMLELPQLDIDTTHTIHDGVYTRTILVPADTLLTGVLIKIPTTLIVCGNAIVYIGDKAIEIKGYHVIPASAGRRQALVTIEDTYFTMVFASDATTVEQAEDQFTDESYLLGSRRDDSNNFLTIIGG